jgi:hypothetical protein
MLLFLPDLALFVKELSSTGNLLAKVREVDVSASSHARERFNKISPSSLPHYKVAAKSTLSKKMLFIVVSNSTDIDKHRGPLK